ncbi:hypothetical protein LCGC14_1104800 [marine sediment metagenome]|uniref:Uncharacterized protein n=1 Tax=marine sediment metagenome TaxID=412755 RepID=A0A0F9PRJ1_9ZZZZ
MSDNDNKAFSKTFDKCPGCGHNEPFFKGILDELHERGLVDKKINAFQFQLEEGIAVPQDKIDSLPIGSEVPAFGRVWDTCCNCGMVYSTHLEIKRFVKGVELARPQVSEMDQGFLKNLRFNNPLLS